jgi:hypothetical protein
MTSPANGKHMTSTWKIQQIASTAQPMASQDHDYPMASPANGQHS